MNKGLEAFERINHTVCSNYNRKNLKLSLSGVDCQNLGMLIDDLDIVEEALQRLDAIDNANPSEALEELFKTTYFGSKEEYDKINVCYNSIKIALLELKAIKESKEYNTIGQSLLKAQAQEKVLSIIFEKNVSIFWVRECKNVEEYNYNIPDYLQLTEEEFELLKRYCCGKESD